MHRLPHPWGQSGCCRWNQFTPRNVHIVPWYRALETMDQLAQGDTKKGT